MLIQSGFAAAAPAPPQEPGLAGSVPTGWGRVAAQVVPASVNILTVKVIGSYRKDKNDAKDRPDTLGQRQRYAGSGFIVDPSGIIVTNRHVIAGALWITVRLQDGSELPAKLVAASPVVDLALLKIDAGHALPALKLAPAGAVRLGDPVLAIGDPLGLGTSLSAGIVSGLQRDLMNTPFDDYVQTDAAINHGNSGGPLIDTAGEVVGVNTILLTNQPNEGSNGLGFAISSTVVAAALRHLLHPEQQQIGWIGVHLQGMTPNLATAFGLPNSRGALITGIDPGSPAGTAGLATGDVILEYGKRAPANARALMAAIALTPVGQTHTLTVWKNGKIDLVPVAVRAWPQESEQPAEVLANPTALLPAPLPDLGMLLAPISPLARKTYKLGEHTGVLVVAVDKMSEAYSRGVVAGVVIEKIQDQPVTTPVQALRLIRDTANRLPLVALLIRWDSGTRWVALHTGYHTETVTRAGSSPRDDAARIGDLSQAAAPSRAGKTAPSSPRR
ncbi:MAG: trypsin-like peptidase domain-containing protein [Rhodospirillales bacterium]|nr:trypsin-like peptidase domain-containing protein [Rhodospirillales bacterium]